MLRATQREVAPTLFTSMMQDFVPRMTMLLGIRTAIDDTLISIRRQIEAVGGGADRQHDVVRTLDSYLASTALAPERMATTLTAAAAAIALGLGILGLSGAMADAARMRRRRQRCAWPLVRRHGASPPWCSQTVPGLRQVD